MSRVVLLDAGPLGMVAHPRGNPEIGAWLRRLVRTATVVAVPEVADYEVRRELLRADKPKSIERLDTLKMSLRYLPITTEVMLQAAAFWAVARRHGQPTAVDAALDADVILAAQAAIQHAPGDEVVIATTNVRHLARLVPAKHWREIR
ncbi:MAG: nuclease [Candidatus Schekmanbacteria bacterium]|nr:nuclease [Candidatus Schekmanbacteria bacterium]